MSSIQHVYTRGQNQHRRMYVRCCEGSWRLAFTRTVDLDGRSESTVQKQTHVEVEFEMAFICVHAHPETPHVHAAVSVNALAHAFVKDTVVAHPVVCTKFPIVYC